MNLSQKKCVPCEGGVPPLVEEESNKFLQELAEGWEVFAEGKKLRRQFTFKDFREAMTFVNKVADIAEEEQHHPDIIISYNKVTIELWTHAIAGLSENDFILASKIDHILAE